MTGPSQAARRVLVIGETLEPIAREAFNNSAVETGLIARLAMLSGIGPVPDLVIIDGAAHDPQILARAIEEMSGEPIVPALILSSAAPSTAVIRALLRLAKSDVLEPPHTAADLSFAAACLLAGSQAHGEAQVDHRCWAIMPAVGGAGATTVAIELACAVARKSRTRERVGLVDLNLADGAAASYLGVAPAMAIANTALAPDRIDAGLLDVLAAKPNPQLDLLAAPRDTRAFEQASPQTILRILDVACHTYPTVIIDMPRHRQSWSLAALGGCDEIIIVSELTVPALLAARALAEEIERDIHDGPAPRIVLNRIASRMFGPAPSLAEAERALGRAADGGVSSDWDAAAASVNLGGPISQHRSRSKIVRDVEALAKRLLAEPLRHISGREAA